MPDPDDLPRAGLLALVREQAQQLQRLRTENTALRDRLDRLERLVSRNSGNSSMPPSADDLPGRTPPAGQPRAGAGGKRKRGKQPGEPGAFLA